MRRGVSPNEELPVNIEVSMGYTAVVMGECLEKASTVHERAENLNLQVIGLS